jgi:hypothetical protein
MFDLANFLNPWLLLCAVGALAPIVIHLIARSRPKPTPFGAVRFIMASHRKSSAKFKLKQFLLLLLRCALLFLLALVIARPWRTGAAGEVQRARATVTAVLLLDHSYSMTYRHAPATPQEAPRSSLEQAKEIAAAAVDAFAPRKSRACLLLVGDTPEPVISDFEYASDLKELKKRIAEVRPTWQGTDCRAALREAVRMLRQAKGLGKSVFLFTDLTRRGWPGALPAAEAGEDITFYIIDVGPEEPVNPAILGVEAPGSAPAGAPFEVRAKVNAVGAAGRQVELAIDGTTQGRRPANAHRVEDVSFVAAPPAGAPEHWGVVSLTGDDPLAVDNRAYFSFRSSPAVKVLLVNGAPAGVARRDELYFLRAALAPEGVTTGQAPELLEIQPAQLASAQLDAADVLALCNVGGMTAADWTKVRHFVSTGRGLLVFGGDRVRPADYRAASQGEAALLPCTLGAAVRPTDGTRLEPGDLKHAILRLFQGGRNGDLAAARFSAYLKLTPSDQVPHEVVLRFKTGDPALVAGRYGAGRVLVFASSCDADWNVFPREVPYPVLWHQCIRYLVESRQERRDVRVGSAPTLRIPTPKTVRRVMLSRVGAGDEEGEDVTERLDRGGSLNLQPVTEPGVYRVRIERAAGEGTEPRFFAANLDTTESNIERLAAEEGAVRSLLPQRTVRVARSREELLDQLSRSESIAELASHFAGIMLLVLLGEMYLSNHMRARVASEEPAGGQ